MARILVVSQHIGMRTLLTAVFKRTHHVDAVTSRAEVMSLIVQSLPDLILLDLYISNEPGLDLASDLRALYPQLPMLFVSSKIEDSIVPEADIHAAAHLRINIFQSTPVGPDFNSLIRGLLERI